MKVPASIALFESLEKIKNHRCYVIYAVVNSIQVVACDDETSARKLADSRSGVIIHGELLDYVKPVLKKEKKDVDKTKPGQAVIGQGSNVHDANVIEQILTTK